jgi:hypothetical protein
MSQVFFRIRASRQFRKVILVCPILVLIFVAGWGNSTASGQVAAGDVHQQVRFNRWALRHIQQRHWPDSPAQGAGKFAPGITEDSLREMIYEAVANGRLRENTHGRSGEIYEYDFGRPIGTAINGGPASRLRVVINTRDEVVTAFPF